MEWQGLSNQALWVWCTHQDQNIRIVHLDESWLQGSAIDHESVTAFAHRRDKLNVKFNVNKLLILGNEKMVAELLLLTAALHSSNPIHSVIIFFLSPLSHWQKSFTTFGLGSNLWILVTNWKKYPCQIHWQRGFLALAMAVNFGLIGVN